MIWAIVGSICVPFGFIGDYPVDVPGIGPVIDGGFSNDCPCLDSYTITASALHNESDISPRYIDSELLGGEYLANPITFLDVLLTPSFDRVWQIAKIGELAVEYCPLMQRKEWKDLRKKKEATINDNSSNKNKNDSNMKLRRQRSMDFSQIPSI